MAGEVNLTCMLSKDHVPVLAQPQLVYVLLESLPAGAVTGRKMPVNVSLVLDTSGSMAGEKIARLKDAVKYVLDLLGDQDCISIIRFASTTSTLVPSQAVGGPAHKAEIKRQVDQLETGGGTTLAPAIRAGHAEVARQAGPGRINRIVLLTDGQTVGEEDCQKAADQAAGDDIPIIALGIGTDWNDSFLQDLGTRSRGQVDYIKEPQEIGQYFGDTVAAMQGAVVQNAVLILRLAAGLEPRKVWRVVPLISDLGYGPFADRAVVLPLGGLGKDEGQALLVELMLPVRPAGSYRVAQAEIAYDVPLLGVVQEKVKVDVMLDFTADPNLARQVNPRVMNIVEKVTAFKLQTRALQEAQTGNIAGATQKLRAAATILLNQGDTELAQTAQQEAARLEQGGEMTSEGQKTIKFKSGKTVKLG